MSEHSQHSPAGAVGDVTRDEAASGPAQAADGKGVLPTPVHRVVVLGASNVARGISTIFETCRLIHGSPLDFCSAAGHGRSYGATSWFLGRSLPGIVDCGLWLALKERPESPTSAVVTDIGNDLLYEVPVEKIAGWIDTCLARLVDAGASVVVTALPLEGVEDLPNWKFLLMRTLFFPRTRLPLSDVLDRARRLNDVVGETAERRGAKFVAQQSKWYGFDPIHITTASKAEAWGTMLARWTATDDEEVPRESAAPRATSTLWDWLRLRFLTPERRTILFHAHGAAQPVLTWRDGSRISYF